MLAGSVNIAVTAPTNDHVEDKDEDVEDNGGALIEHLGQENNRLKQEVAILRRLLADRIGKPPALWTALNICGRLEHN
jgi:hypothetical protein